MNSRYVKSLIIGMAVHIMSAITVIRQRMTFGPLLLASFLLASCGGGGGSSGAPPPVTTPPSDLQYPPAPTFVVDTAITALTPTVVGEVTSYSESPALPAGLSLNTTSGVISGTPTSVAAKTNYTVKATNAGGSTTAVLSIVVMTAAPSDLKYPTPLTFVVGTAIAPVKPTVVGEVTSYSESPALPAGLSLNTTTGIISGTPTSVAAKADYTVKATNAGGSTTATVSIVVTAAPAAYTAKSGVAQKGPLIQGSMVTAQELDASLSPTGQQFSYQILNNLGAFSPTSTFTSPYIGLDASGYYFDEVANAVSTGTVTLYAYSDLAVDAVLNVNLLTTLEYQRIQYLVTKSNMTFAAARTQAENEVLAALNVPAGSYGSFDSLDLSGSTDGDHILAAISALFVYGNSSGPLSQLIAGFQSDIGKNGVITNPATTAALVAAAKGINPATVAANLTKFYAAEGLIFTAADITEWIAQSGDGVIGRFAFSVPDATPSTVFTFPPYVVTQFAGTPVSVSVGRLSINGTAASGTVTFTAGDTVTVSPNVGDFPSGVLNSYLVTGKRNLARVSFISGLVSIAITPKAPNVPLGLTQQLTATGTFSDTSTADLTSKVVWASGTPTIARIDASSGLASALEAGSTVITATSGSVSGSTTLTVTGAVLESLAITPAKCGVGLNEQLVATGTYSDGTTANLTNIANWTSSTTSVATVGATTGLATCLSPGSTTITATVGSVTQSSLLTAITAWLPAGNMFSFGNWCCDAFYAFLQLDIGTLLQNGMVLIAGPSGGSLYNPVANTWSDAGGIGASGATGTLLQSGKVLAAGGDNGNGSGVATVEIYDPASGWSFATSMTTPRLGHTATLLPNGKVLIAGGACCLSGSPLATAEIYDPVANTWTAAASMNVGRQNHTATLLQNGLVLVAGGGTADAETYDPVANTWTTVAGMLSAPQFHTATLLPNGKVLIAGGQIGTFRTNLTATLTMTAPEVYDPVANTWSPAGVMVNPRAQHGAALLQNGKVIVVGGTDGTTFENYPAALASAELYDPATNTWAPTDSMSVDRYNPVVVLLQNGVVLAAGGSAAGNMDIVTFWSSVELYW